MLDFDKNIAVILAGGKSSRMGKNKALLDFKGKPLFSHMFDLVKSIGFTKVFISGEFEGYPCILDKNKFSGPCCAIRDILHQFKDMDGFLFIPVDMPLLDADILRELVKQKEGAYFIDYPLPVWITKPYTESKALSIKYLLNDLGIYPLDIPNERQCLMLNANTPEDWNLLQKEIKNEN